MDSSEIFNRYGYKPDDLDVQVWMYIKICNMHYETMTTILVVLLGAIIGFINELKSWNGAPEYHEYGYQVSFS